MRLRPAQLRVTLLLAAALAVFGAAPAAAAQLRGAQMHPLWSDSDQIDQEFALLQSAHADSVRIDLPWQSLEWTGRGVYDPGVVSKMDSIMAGATSHGLKVILTLWETPCWASSAPASLTSSCGNGWWNTSQGTYPPALASDYAEAAAYVAKRWGSEMAALELWNEPNSSQFLTSATPAADYAKLVKAAYPAVKAVAPNLPVLATMGGTDQWFLHNLYGNGIGGSYDGIVVHSYNDPGLVQLQAFRAYELAQGDNTPLWVTEFGATSTAVGEQAQAGADAATLDQLATLAYVSAAEVYNLRDTGSDPTNDEDNFGLLNRDMSPKPAWTAFVQALADLAAPAPAPAPASAPAPSPATITAAATTTAPAAAAAAAAASPAPAPAPVAATTKASALPAATPPTRQAAVKPTVRHKRRAARRSTRRRVAHARSAPPTRTPRG